MMNSRTVRSKSPLHVYFDSPKNQLCLHLDANKSDSQPLEATAHCVNEALKGGVKKKVSNGPGQISRPRQKRFSAADKPTTLKEKGRSTQVQPVFTAYKPKVTIHGNYENNDDALKPLFLPSTQGDHPPTSQTKDAPSLQSHEATRALARKLLEAEIGAEVLNEDLKILYKLIPELLQEGHYVTSKDLTVLRDLRDRSLRRLEEFQVNLEHVRVDLQPVREKLTAVEQLAEQNSQMSERLEDYAEINRRLQRTVVETTSALEDANHQVEILRDENVAETMKMDSLEALKTHMQTQLRQRDADCNRLSTDNRSLEAQLVQCKLDCEYLTSLLKENQNRDADGKESLKKAARLMKKKLKSTEETLVEEQGKRHLLEEHVRNVERELEVERRSHTDTKSELRSVHAELGVFMRRSRDNDSVDGRRSGHHQVLELEEHVQQLQEEKSRLQVALDQSEANCHRVEKELQKCHDKQREEETAHRERAVEWNGKSQSLQQELSHLMDRLQECERKLKNVEAERDSLQSSLVKRDDTVRQLQRALEDKSRENSTQSRQLETALQDARHQKEANREKQLVKDRQMQAQIHELEAEMLQLRSECTRLGYEKTDLERRTQSQLSDMRSQLEQSDVAARSMKKYIQFLKKSFTNTTGTPLDVATFKSTSPTVPTSAAAPAGGVFTS